jgi:hypothetical protein
MISSYHADEVQTVVKRRKGKEKPVCDSLWVVLIRRISWCRCA